MRTELELLILLRDYINNLKERGIIYKGLCSYAVVLCFFDDKITREEHRLLRVYLSRNLPSDRVGDFCWPPYVLEPRLAWLDEQITKLQTQN